MIKKELGHFHSPKIGEYLTQHQKTAVILMFTAGLGFGFGFGGSEKVRELAYPAITAIKSLTEQFIK